MKLIIPSILLVATAGAFGAPDVSKLPPASKKTGVTYEQDIKPLFEQSCVRCHGNDRPKARLNLTTLQGVLKGSKDGEVVKSGNSADSPLVIAVARIDEETAMPPMRRGRGPGGPGRQGGKEGNAGPEAGTNAPAGGKKGPMGPPPKPLTPQQVGLVRAWIDQGAK